MIAGIQSIDSFITHPTALFGFLKDNVVWDQRMAARKTASFGVPYNYSQIKYPFQEFPEALQPILSKLKNALNFDPNNCLINYYLNGHSKMGFHSDQTDILAEGTGIAILSLGVTRTLRFRNINDKNSIQDYELASGSLFYMNQEVQAHWQHAIPKSNTNLGRMSLTFRQLIT